MLQILWHRIVGATYCEMLLLNFAHVTPAASGM